VLAKLLKAGYHGGLALGRWYPGFANCVTIAVTEKRTRAELDGFVAAFKNVVG
jgi:glycine dehydrogenase subunit 1